MNTVKKEVQDFLAPFDPAVRDLALSLRKLVLQTVPDAVEQVHRPWKTISYGVGGKFCVIAPHQARVNLQFHTYLFYYCLLISAVGDKSISW